MDSVISTDHLSRNYRKVEAVRDLTLEVPRGSFFALLGPNGAGKTTTIHTLMNLLAPSSGQAAILGVDSKRLGPAQLARIGYVSENQKLPGWMTVEHLLAFCLLNRARRQAFLLTPSSYVLDQSLIMFGVSLVYQSWNPNFIMPLLNSRPISTIDNGWLAGANMVVIKRNFVGHISRKFEIKNFRMADYSPDGMREHPLSVRQ
jgi:ABC-type sugar transport system ATPase subunit